MTMLMMMTVTVTITVTVTSGHRREDKPAVPTGPSFASAAEVAMMSRYAQTVADHVGWFS